MALGQTFLKFMNQTAHCHPALKIPVFLEKIR